MINPTNKKNNLAANLMHFDEEQKGMPLGPKGRHIFGTITLGERGQIVLPKAARDMLGLKKGDTLVVLGDENQGTAGIALIPSNLLLPAVSQFMSKLQLHPKEEE